MEALTSNMTHSMSSHRPMFLLAAVHMGEVDAEGPQEVSFAYRKRLHTGTLGLNMKSVVSESVALRREEVEQVHAGEQGEILSYVLALIFKDHVLEIKI